MQRSLRWARGRLISVTAADQLLRDLAELIQEVELSTQHGQQGKHILCRFLDSSKV